MNIFKKKNKEIELLKYSLQAAHARLVNIEKALQVHQRIFEELGLKYFQHTACTSSDKMKDYTIFADFMGYGLYIKNDAMGRYLDSKKP